MKNKKNSTLYVSKSVTREGIKGILQTNKMRLLGFVIIALSMFVPTHYAIGQSISNDLRLTATQQSVLKKMGAFFDETIRDNFPAKIDTLSYKSFFHCLLIDCGIREALYILQVDRKKLAKINAELFKDENYCFFYDNQYVKDSEHIFTHYFFRCPYNPEGYFPQFFKQHINNPMVKEIDSIKKISGSFNFTLFMHVTLHFHLEEIRNPEIQQFVSFIFWRYLCFCGGVDLITRKGFCTACTVND